MSNRRMLSAAAIALCTFFFSNVSGYAQQVINCSSDDGQRHSCAVDARGGVQLTNQRSGSTCQRGSSWGTDEAGIWVDHGCRADFTVNAYVPYQAGAGGAGTINCSSDDGERHTCAADIRGGVQLVNQRSGSPCQRGASWGTDRDGIWVDHGCRADFAVNPYHAYPNPESGRDGTITCSSDDGGRHECPADTSGGALLINQRSGSPCQRGYSWGEDERGLWVDHGCRADFQVGSATDTPAATSLITCSSDDNERHSCAADTYGGVRLVRQISGSACKRGYSWGADERGIWVDHGCRAEFVVGTFRR